MGTVLETTTADPAAGTENILAERALTLDTTKPMRALLLENIHPDATARLTKANYEVETRAGALSEDELIEAVRGVNLLGIRSRTHVTDRVLAAAPDLVAVGAFCIGVNQIDIAAAARRGVAVFNAPFSNTRSVVELVLAEIISMARRLAEKNMKMHAGVWDNSASGSHEVRGRSRSQRPGAGQNAPSPALPVTGRGTIFQQGSKPWSQQCSPAGGRQVPSLPDGGPADTY